MLLAHSKSIRAPAQSYKDHVYNVLYLVKSKSEQMLRYYRGNIDKTYFKNIIEYAAQYHDIGKLYKDCQDILNGKNTSSVKMFNHVDAGSAFILQLHEAISQPNDNGLLISATIIEGHHIGLLNGNYKKGSGWWSYTQRSKENGDNFLRDTRSAEIYGIKDGRRVCDVVNDNLSSLVKLHHEDTGITLPSEKDILFNKINLKDIDSLTIRMMMSILCDADHTDTAASQKWCTVDPQNKIAELNPEKRLIKLKEYVDLLSKKYLNNIDKNILLNPNNKTLKYKREKVFFRKRLFEDCCSVNINERIYILDGPVGSGKTFGSLAVAYRLSDKYKLRRIFYIAPFTNIISQTVSNIKKSSKIIGDPSSDYVVGEHHHSHEYFDQAIKAHTVGWDCPIICTTAVQFIESLCSNKTVPLKKIHNVAGSVIIFDEYENIIPLYLWETFSNLVNSLIKEWGCKVILSSGSPTKMWRINELRCEKITPKKTILSKDTKKVLNKSEKQRVKITYQKYFMFGHEAIAFFRSFSGPRLIICNTLRNAALLAHYMRLNSSPDEKIYHVSNALSINDRDKILKNIKNDLEKETEDKKKNITVISTSLIESGIDLSFHHGFVEAKEVRSTHQASGRVNRNNEYEDSQLIVFSLKKDNDFPFTFHPEFKNSIEILLRILDKKNTLTLSDCTIAERKLVELSSIASDMEILRDAENNKEFRTVKENARVIQDWKVPVLSSADLFIQLANGDLHSSLSSAGKIWKNLTRDSFTLFGSSVCDGKYSLLCLKDHVEEWYYNDPILNKIEPGKILLWNGGYDKDFLGYMNDVLFKLGIPGIELSINPADFVIRNIPVLHNFNIHFINPTDIDGS